jgi:hypothetical protein
MWESLRRPDPTDLTRIVDAIPTVATLGLLFPLPAAFAHDLHSLPSIVPSLEYVWAMLDDSPAVQDHFLKAIESRWQSGRLKSVKMYTPQFAPNIVKWKELFCAQGMEFTVFHQDYYLLRDMIPSDMYIESEG